MARTRKIARSEMRDTVVNLIDLGFTAPAVAFMLNRTAPVIYQHLKAGGRMKGNKIVPQSTFDVVPGAAIAMRRVFSHEAWCLAMVVVSHAASRR